MNVADTCCQEINSQICNSLALVGIRTLTCTHNTIFLTADRPNFSLNRQSHRMGNLHQLSGLFHILLNGIVRTIKHNGGKSCLDALVAALIAAMIQMQRNRNRNVHLLDHSLHHGSYGLISCHILAGALRHTQNNRGIELLRSSQNRFGPLQVVNVKLTHRIMSRFCFFQHFCCRY